MNGRILRALLRKEVLLMRRNPIIPKMILMMPLMVMLVLPLVANLDVKHVDVLVVDNDQSILSRRIATDINATDEMDVVGFYDNYLTALKALESGSGDVILCVPYGFSKSLATGRMLNDRIDIEANGVNATKGTLGGRYVAQSAGNTILQWSHQHGIIPPKQGMEILNRYNPTLNFKNYMVPALMVVLLIIICGFVPALNLVNEKETGTIEAMNVSPVSRFGFVLSKLIPFWIVGLFVVSVGILIGWLVYGLIPQGNILAIYLAAILFSLVMSGLGVTIANTSSTMLQSIFVMFAFIMIFQLMGGLFTPIRSMPDWAQYVTYAVPPRYFIEIMRSLYLKATPISELWLQFTLLGGFAAVLSGLAALTYKKQS